MGQKKIWSWRILLILLLACITASTVYFVANHHMPLYGDPVSNLIPSVYLRQALESGSLEELKLWVKISGNRPPLPSFIYLPAMFMMEDQLAAIRYTELAAFLLCLLLLFALGERHAGGAAGLLAAALFGLFPHTLGWSHMANADPFIWLGLLLLFALLLRLDLRRPGHAVALGCAVGFCAGVRLLCFPYLVGALAVTVFTTRWRLRTLANLLLAGVCALAVSGWWFLLKSEIFLESTAMASGNNPISMGKDIWVYLGNGMDVFIVGALLAGMAAWRGRLIPARYLLLFALWIVLPLLQFVFIWDSWSRYLLPLFPPCLLLTTVVLERVMVRWPALMRAATRGLVLMIGVLPLLYFLNEPYMPLEVGHLVPSEGAFDGFSEVVADLPDGTPILGFGGCHDPMFMHGINLTRRHPRVKIFSLPGTRSLFELKPGVEVSYLLRTDDVTPGIVFDNPSMRERASRWLDIEQRLPMVQVTSSKDEDHVLYVLYRFPRPMRASELRYLSDAW